MSNFGEKFRFRTILPGKDCEIFGENNDKKFLVFENEIK